MMGSDGPIFLGGLSHTGKTPIRRALATHSRISMSRRTYMWTRYLDRFGDLGTGDNLERCIGAMMREKGILALAPDVAGIRHRFQQGEPTYARLFSLFHEQAAARRGKSRWGDQLGMVEAFAERIFTAFPSARMIHMVRDPRDVGDGPGGRARSAGKLGWRTAQWLRSADLAIRNQEAHPGRYRVVRFEELVADPAGTLGEIMRFVDEDLEPGMVDRLDGVPRAAELASEARPETTKLIERYTAARLDSLDYAPTRETSSVRVSLGFYVVDMPVHRAGMAAWNTLGARSRALPEPA